MVLFRSCQTSLINIAHRRREHGLLIRNLKLHHVCLIFQSSHFRYRLHIWDEVALVSAALPNGKFYVH
jgi:hypothetical protein